ncbi:MAG: hypothetical protein V3V30_08635 [Parvularculaceae bacterium]
MSDTDLKASAARALKNPLRDKKKCVRENPETKPAVDALSAIEATFFVIDEIRDNLIEASELVLSAMTAKDVASRSIFAERYDELRQSITKLVEQADPEAAKLLGQQAKGVNVSLEGSARYSLSPVDLTISETGLDLPPPAQGLSTNTEIALILEKLDEALAKLGRISNFYMRDAKFLMARIDAA